MGQYLTIGIEYTVPEVSCVLKKIGENRPKTAENRKIATLAARSYTTVYLRYDITDFIWSLDLS